MEILMSASLFTNASAQTALQTLSAASKSLSATQNRVSTGFRISTAEDNAAYWQIATQLRSDVLDLGNVKQFTTEKEIGLYDLFSHRADNL
jgi:flagellin